MKVECAECERQFTQKKSLYAHIRNIHKRNLVVLKKNPIIKCDECAVMFRQKKHLYAHARKFHNKNLFTFKKNPDLECNDCKKIFSTKASLRKHEINMHKNDTDHNYTKPSCKTSRLVCPQKLCIKKFLNYESLREHLNSHNVEVVEEDHEFASLESFKSWKNNIQENEKSFYTLDTGPKKLSTLEAWNLYYNCHRSYFYVPKGKHNRTLKLNSYKIGKACPSRMKVTMIGNLDQPSLVRVKYWKTHFGHKL